MVKMRAEREITFEQMLFDVLLVSLHCTTRWSTHNDDGDTNVRKHCIIAD